MFRTIRASDPRYERDALRCITVKSPALRGRADLSCFIPAGTAPLPLVILLHGVYGSHWSWSMKGGVHLTAQRLIDSGAIAPLAVAMPSDGLWGDGSGYLPHPDRDFERWIVEEVPAAVALENERVLADGPLAIGGLSMGGFGALRIGAKHGRRFRGVSGHSSITHFDQLAQFVEEPLETYRAQDADRSVLETILRHADTLPALRFDCGLSDPLLADNRALHAALERAGVPHTYEEFPGGHEWSYWERHIETTLRFFDACFRDQSSS
ncbi:MAG: alpha/beta hydrolase-fold protein [Rhodothermales bacterium]